MIPQSQPRKVANSSKVNLAISLAFHFVVGLIFFYFAAHEGLLGEKLEKITIQLVKVTPPEPPKKVEPPKPPKVEPPKAAPPKIVEPPRVEPPKVVAAPKPVAPPPVASRAPAAPPATELPTLDFAGGKTVETSSDPVEIYKSFVEYEFHAKWNQPEDIAKDRGYVTQVELTIGRDGQVSNPAWLQNSGDQKWNDSIRQAIAAVGQLDRPPPTNFPPRLTVVFNVADVAESSSESLTP